MTSTGEKKVFVGSLASRLTNPDKRALLDAYSSACGNTKRRVYGIGKLISHYRWRRLVAVGAAENITTRLTVDGYLTARIIHQIGPI